jgi:hypothetical protein
LSLCVWSEICCGRRFRHKLPFVELSTNHNLCAKSHVSREIRKESRKFFKAQIKWHFSRDLPCQMRFGARKSCTTLLTTILILSNSFTQRVCHRN